MHARPLPLRSIAFAALTTFTACGAQTDQGAATLETGTDAPAMHACGDEEALSSSPMEAPADPAKWMKEHLPQWKAYFEGSPYDACHGLYRWPDRIDHNVQLHVERVDPPVRFRLSAVQLRNVGEPYLWRLVDRHNLDILDVLMLSAMLSAPLDQIPVSPPAPENGLRVRTKIMSQEDDAEEDDRLTREPDAGEEEDGVSTCDEGTPSPSIPGDWGPDNHTVGPGVGWPSAPAPQQPSGGWGPPLRRKQPPGWPPAWPPPHRVQPPSRTDPHAPGGRSPNGDPGGYSNRDFSNGLKPGDTPLGPYPGSQDPRTCPPESREVFKCQGKVYTGCTSLCPDYSLNASERWAQGWNDIAKKWNVGFDDAAFRTYIRHKLWNDGKNPGCQDNCEAFGYSICTSEAVLLAAGCDIVTGGACHPALLASWYAGVGATTAVYACSIVLKRRCITNECDL